MSGDIAIAQLVIAAFVGGDRVRSRPHMPSAADQSCVSPPRIAIFYWLHEEKELLSPSMP
jgi:hypothetical protein